LREFGYFLENSSYPRRIVRRIKLISPVGRTVVLKLDEPFAIFSRKVLNGLVLDRALEAGAQFVNSSVANFSRDENGWRLTTGCGSTFHARFMIGADGAASPTRRRLVGIFPKQDLALAFGYNVSEDSFDPDSNGVNAEGKMDPRMEEVVVQFPRDFTGYLWAFPRPGVMNFGVASKLGTRTSDELRSILTGFVKTFYGGEMPGPERASFFGAKIPTLDLASWKDLRAVGEGWALVGDAAGFADPITGEGIYYAFKSSDLLADALLAASGLDHAKAADRYEKMWRDEFGRELEHASYRLPQFYHSRFFGSIFTDAVIRLARFHRGVRTVLIRALMGEQSYVTLKRDLLARAYQLF
jgi:flavin-dependent dehydrogenase